MRSSCTRRHASRSVFERIQAHSRAPSGIEHAGGGDMTFVPLKDLRSSGDDGLAAAGRQAPARERLPPWFKVRLHRGPDYNDIRSIMDRLQLHTICEEARCPNMWECWNARTATFLI